MPVRQYGSFLPGSGVGGAGEHWNGACLAFPAGCVHAALAPQSKNTGRRSCPPISPCRIGASPTMISSRTIGTPNRCWASAARPAICAARSIDGGNPFEGPRQNEYPTPPLKDSYLSTLFADGAKKLGYHPYPQPACNLSQTYKNPDGITRPACAYCGYCERFGCMIGAKAQPSNTLMPVLAQRKNFELRTGAWVRRIVHKDGQATGVAIRRRQWRGIFPARRNRVSGHVHAEQHAAAVLVENRHALRFRHAAKARWAATSRIRPKATRALFRQAAQLVHGHRRAQHAHLRFRRRPRLRPDRKACCAWECSAPTSLATVRSARSTPCRADRQEQLGLGVEGRGAQMARSQGRHRLTGEHLSYRQNFMDLDPTYTDKFGDPLLRFTLDWTEHEHRQRIRREIARKIARAMGAKADDSRPARGKYNVINYQTTHIQGGAIMGVIAGDERGQPASAALEYAEPVGDRRVGVSAERVAQSDAHGARADLPGGGCHDQPIFEESRETGMKRRRFLTIPAAALGGTLLYSLVARSHSGCRPRTAR